jgi:hypothetical protein
VTASWDPVNGASFHTTGLTVDADFTDVATPGFAGDPSHGFSFVARTGGHNETLLIDNLVVNATAGSGGGAGAAPLNIIFVSFHETDEASADAAAADPPLTEASDKGYTDLLAANGHTVTRWLTRNDPTADDAASLNAADLIIISRAVASNNYQQEAEFWNTQITTPVMNLGGYTFRSSRLNWTNGGTMVDSDAPVVLDVADASHPIFAGADLAEPYANFIEGERGVSFNTDEVVGGTVLATAAGGPVAGGAAIFEFAAGAEVNNGNVLAGPRLAFLTGSRELGRTSQTSGFYDLTASGETMFLNAVNYIGGKSAAGQRTGAPLLADLDSDGVSDLSENIAGTNANDRSDYFQIGALSNSADGVAISFEGVAGRVYEVEFSQDLTPGSWKTVGSQFADESSTVEIIDSRTQNAQGYYRARVVQD